MSLANRLRCIFVPEKIHGVLLQDLKIVYLDHDTLDGIMLIDRSIECYLKRVTSILIERDIIITGWD